MAMSGLFQAISEDQLDDWLHDRKAFLRDLATYEFDTADRLDLGRSWHALNYLVTGALWGGKGAIGDAILGGRSIGPDLGCGPARYLTAVQVWSTALALEKVSVTLLRERFERMSHEAIYSFDGFEGEETFHSLVAKVEELTRFYRRAADAGQAMLLRIARTSDVMFAQSA